MFEDNPFNERIPKMSKGSQNTVTSTLMITDVLSKVPSFSHLVLVKKRYELGLELFNDQRSEKFLAIEQLILQIQCAQNRGCNSGKKN